MKERVGISAAASLAAIVIVLALFARARADGVADALAPLLKPGESGFRYDGCGIRQEDVTRFVLLGKAFEHQLKFGPGCDAQGLLVIDTRGVPLDLQVRNLGPVRRIRGRLTSAAGGARGAPFGFSVEVTDGELTFAGGRAPASFSSDTDVKYSSIFNIGRNGVPDARIHVTSFDGRNVGFKGRLEFKGHAE